MRLSNRTLVRTMELLSQVQDEIRKRSLDGTQHWTRKLYEFEFRNWFITHASSAYEFDWDSIIRDLRSTEFFETNHGRIIDRDETFIRAAAIVYLHKLVALVASNISADFDLNVDALIRSLDHDGFSVNAEKVSLVESQGPVSLDRGSVAENGESNKAG